MKSLSTHETALVSGGADPTDVVLSAVGGVLLGGATVAAWGYGYYTLVISPKMEEALEKAANSFSAGMSWGEALGRNLGRIEQRGFWH